MSQQCNPSTTSSRQTEVSSCFASRGTIADALLGTGYVKRQEKVMYDFLDQKGEKSPFHMALEANATADETQTEQLSEKLEAQISAVLEEIWAHFDGMIDPDEQDPAEQPLREELRVFLETASPAFDAFRKGLSEIGRKKKTCVKTEDIADEQADLQ